MRFDDQAYLDDYYQNSKYPKIHDDIFKVAKWTLHNKPMVVLDLGACTGLISARIANETTANTVIAVEGNKKSIERAVKHPDIVYENLMVKESTLPQLEKILQQYKPEMVVARRVFPEIAEESVETVKNLGKLFALTGVKYIITEGRKPTKNAKNPLSNGLLECMALSTYYRQIMKYKEVYKLIRR